MRDEELHERVLGTTHYRWTPEVSAVVQRVLNRWPNVTANTYEDHPWPGWDGVSVDFWGPGGRGAAIPRKTGRQIRKFLMNLRGRPMIRHTIWLHQLWTSWGAYSYWAAEDHSGRLRHLHVTYWK